MGDYKVLHTFSPSVELWGYRSDSKDDEPWYHERVIYLAMCEVVAPNSRTPEHLRRSVKLFTIEGNEVTPCDYDTGAWDPKTKPCHKMMPGGWLICDGHTAAERKASGS
jgi:hypothetical protein